MTSGAQTKGCKLDWVKPYMGAEHVAFNFPSWKYLFDSNK